MVTVSEVLKMWDFQNPIQSEANFRQALEVSDPLSGCVLTTQIARTFGIRGDFNTAKRILAQLGDPDVQPLEVQAWYWLEMGRSTVSATHSPKDLTEDALVEAKRYYAKAIDLSERCGLEYLAVDAMHMMVLVHREPKRQLEWNYLIIDRINRSSDQNVRQWLGPVHNNIAYALHLSGQYENALGEFNLSKKAYQEGNDQASVGIENWMIAWTYRVMGRTHDALALQLENERVNTEAGTPDFYVFDELNMLYREIGDVEKGNYYGKKKEEYAPAI